MAKLRVAVLYDIWYEEEETSAEEAKPVRRKRKPDKEDRQEIHEALREAGHSPFYVTVDGTRESLADLTKTECDLVFNLTASWAGDDTKAVSYTHLRAHETPEHLV